MFWEVWRRNVACGKWSFRAGDNTCSSSGKLVPEGDRDGGGDGGGGGGGCGFNESGEVVRGPPKKSFSQPENLTCSAKKVYEVEDAVVHPGVAEEKKNCPEEESPVAPLALPLEEENGTTLVGVTKKKKRGLKLKHSFSSFFPFTATSSSSVAPSPVTTPNDPLKGRDDRTFVDHFKWEIPRQEEEEEEQKQESGMKTEVDLENGIIILEDEASDPDDEVNPFQCDVCDRAYLTERQLAMHKKKKRHYACVDCDSVFPSREILECHREEMCQFHCTKDGGDCKEVDVDVDLKVDDDHNKKKKKFEDRDDEKEQLLQEDDEIHK